MYSLCVFLYILCLVVLMYQETTVCVLSRILCSVVEVAVMLYVVIVIICSLVFCFSCFFFLQSGFSVLHLNC